ncbi:MAG: hypothetical protein ACKOU6_15350 [Planctomycetota bacterium]
MSAMNVTFACPSCDQTTRSELLVSPGQLLTCRHCGQQIAVPAGAVSDRQVTRCVVCPSTELYVRKDFSQRWGVLIVIAGFIASSIAWYSYHIVWTYAILFATALLDVILYLFMGNMLQCYRCQAQYRGVVGMDEHQPFHLETHEKHRQQTARLATSSSDPVARESS